MKRVLYILFGIVFLLPLCNAWECEYGEINVWIKLHEDVGWRETPVEDITLKVHEPFEVKIEVRIKKECHLDLHLYEPGATPAFEIIDGPSRMDEDIHKENAPAGQTYTYNWVIRSTENWAGGTAPLNFYAQFTKTMSDACAIDKTILLAYISSEEWNGDANGGGGDENGGGGIPGFETGFLLAAVGMSFVLIRRKTKK